MLQPESFRRGFHTAPSVVELLKELYQAFGVEQVARSDRPRASPTKSQPLIRLVPRYQSPPQCVVAYYFPSVKRGEEGWYDITVTSPDRKVSWQLLSRQLDQLLKLWCDRVGVRYVNPLSEEPDDPYHIVVNLVLNAIGKKPQSGEPSINPVLRAIFRALQAGEPAKVVEPMLAYLKVLGDPALLKLCENVEKSQLIGEIQRLKQEMADLREVSIAKPIEQPVVSPPAKAQVMSPGLTLLLASLVMSRTSAPAGAEPVTPKPAPVKTVLPKPTKPSPPTKPVTEVEAPVNEIDVRISNQAGARALRATNIPDDGFLDMLSLTDVTDDTYRAMQLARVDASVLADIEVAMHNAYGDIFHVLVQLHGLRVDEATERLREIYTKVVPTYHPRARANRVDAIIAGLKAARIVFYGRIDASRLSMASARQWRDNHNTWVGAIGLPKEYILKIKQK